MATAKKFNHLKESIPPHDYYTKVIPVSSSGWTFDMCNNLEKEAQKFHEFYKDNSGEIGKLEDDVISLMNSGTISDMDADFMFNSIPSFGDEHRSPVTLSTLHMDVAIVRKEIVKKTHDENIPYPGMNIYDPYADDGLNMQGERYNGAESIYKYYTEDDDMESLKDLIATRIAEIDETLAFVNTVDEASQEALNSNVLGRAFVSVADSFVGILNTFRTNMTKFPKALKRSELREFVNSNVLKVRTVNGLSFDKVMKQQMYVPANMNVVYVVGCEDVLNAYNKLGAVNLANTAEVAFTNVFKSLSREDGKAGQLVASANAVVGRAVKAAQPVLEKCQNDFQDGAVTNVDFVKAYQTMEEFRMSQSALLDMEPQLQGIAGLEASVTRIENVLKSICNIISANDEVMAKPDVMALGELAKGVALIFEAHSMAATRQLALEHNTVLNINKLYDKVR